ncbi:hypothetical protein [Ruminococcus sp.]|jgi:hypothetical protein
MRNTTVETASKKMKSSSGFVQDCFKKLRRQNALLRSMDWEEGIWENPRKS